MKLLDIHAHLNFPDYDNDREQVLAGLAAEEVGVINIGTTTKTSQEVVELAASNPNMWAAVGIHPHDATETADLLALEELARQDKVVAIGECGLDFFRLKKAEDKKAQENLFISQVELAIRLNKPLMLHVRDAYPEVLDILNNYPAAKAHAHFFAGDVATARDYLARGCTLSFTGVITFTQDYDEVIQYVPMDRLMIETDAPYVAPVPYRGRRNDPRYVRYVAERVAELKGLSPEKVISSSIDNARAVFGL